MTPAAFLETVIRPTLERMGRPFASPEAEVLLAAIALQETGLRTRVQDGGGPGRSFWQIEAGLDALDRHPRGSELLWLGVRQDFPPSPIAFSPRLLRAALADPDMDRLACRIARLLLWTLPESLARMGESGVAWEQYVKAWRPGIERPLDWPENYRAALAAVTDGGGIAPGAAA